MPLNRLQKRNIAILVFVANSLLFVLLQRPGVLSGGLKFLLLLCQQVISLTALYFMLRYSSKSHRVIFLIVPLMILFLALLTFMWVHV